MATRGRKPKPTMLRLIEGSAGAPNLPKDAPLAEGRPVPPPYIKGRALALWNEYLPEMPYLAKLDGPKFAHWCRAEADYEKNGELWPTARHAEQRKLASELGMDPTARTRISSGGNTGKPDEGEDFFGKRA